MDNTKLLARLVNLISQQGPDALEVNEIITQEQNLGNNEFVQLARLSQTLSRELAKD